MRHSVICQRLHRDQGLCIVRSCNLPRSVRDFTSTPNLLPLIKFVMRFRAQVRLSLSLWCRVRMEDKPILHRVSDIQNEQSFGLPPFIGHSTCTAPPPTHTIYVRPTSMVGDNPPQDALHKGQIAMLAQIGERDRAFLINCTNHVPPAICAFPYDTLHEVFSELHDPVTLAFQSWPRSSCPVRQNDGLAVFLLCTPWPILWNRCAGPLLHISRAIDSVLQLIPPLQEHRALAVQGAACSGIGFVHIGGGVVLRGQFSLL